MDGLKHFFAARGEFLKEEEKNGKSSCACLPAASPAPRRAETR
jgi:hypothetical protein